MLEEVILVNEQDVPIGTCEKLLTHKKGLLHRAFSIFLYRVNKQGLIEILLQRRHENKYHCGGLWTNACCSHPRKGETVLSAANRRLNEELGIIADLQYIGNFIYKEKLANNLIEHEYDHVLIGKYENFPNSPDWNNEVQSIKWMLLSSLLNDIEQHNYKYTPWLSKALQIILQTKGFYEKK